jgi:type II secretory pathway pseudopilin PulG
MKSRRHTAAFTMVELMVAIAIAVIVTAAIYSLYSNYVKAFIAQDRVLETQQTARIAIDTLTQDLLRAGYKVAGTQPAVVFAAASDLQLEMFNEQARHETTGVVTPQTERIRYVLAGTDLRREVFRLVGPTWTVIPELSGVLAENVMFQDLNGNSVQDAGEAPALQFTYYTQSAFETNPTSPTALDVTTPRNATGTPPSAADSAILLGIREVNVTLTVRSAQTDPVTGRFVYRTLRGDVKPRNAGLMSTIKDASPPAVPTGLASADKGDCGFLYVSWAENTEPDLAGYTLYYGTSLDPLTSQPIYLNSVTIGRGISHTAGAGAYRLSGLQNTATYYLAVSAHDYSGNSSAISAAINGTGPAPANDTTPNLANPDGTPVAFTGTIGDSSVTLSWNRVDEPDVVGYRVYRKVGGTFNATDFANIRTGSLAPSIYLVASEGMFSPSTAPNVTATGSGFSLVDTAEVKGCVDYYYAVTAIKGCSVSTPQPLNGTPPYPDTLFATLGPKTPTDPTPPGQPMLTTFPSYLRNYLNLTNPTANLDFTHTLVAYKTGPETPANFPTITKNPTTGVLETNGTFLECYDDGYGPGSFTGAGTTGIVHKGANGTCAATFSLNPSVTYFYTAVAADTCKNLSTPVQGQSQVQATQCSDETEFGHPAVGNPPKVTGIRGNTGLNAGVMTSTLAWTGIDFSFTQIRDFAGYYVFRTFGDTTATTPVPTLGNIDDVKGLVLSPSIVYAGLDAREGTINRVRALGVDCETVTKDTPTHGFLDTRYGAPAAADQKFDVRASDTLIFYPGTLGHDTTVPTKTLGKTFNLVRFETKTTINAAATPGPATTPTDPNARVEFKSLTFRWVNAVTGAGSDRLLKSVKIDFDKDGTWDYTITPLSPVSSGTLLSAVGTGFRGGATNAVFELQFINSTTGTASKADMRKLPINATTVYVPVTRLDSDTALPFVFDAAQQATVIFDVPAVTAPAILEVYDSNFSSPTWSPAVQWPLPGQQTYPATEAIDFLVRVVDNSTKGIDKIRVLYAVTPKTATAPPSYGAGFPTTITGYTPVTLCDNDGATTPGVCTPVVGTPADGYYDFRSVIAAQLSQRVWYFIMVDDKAGNYAVAPPQDTVDANDVYYYDHLSGGPGGKTR